VPKIRFINLTYLLANILTKSYFLKPTHLRNQKKIFVPPTAQRYLLFQIFFYIKSKMIVGALVAEAKAVAHKLLTTHQDQVDLCSEEAYPIKCGVSRIWVAQNQRQKGVATALMDCLKRNFMFGYIMRNEDVAFSSPTEMGKIFGKSYFKTPNFLIYFV
jgi:N-acetyltransferase